MGEVRRVKVFLAAVAMIAIGAASAHAQTRGKAVQEDYVREPLPSGFQVVISDYEGPVFADAAGKTLYYWPVTALRNGDAGEQKGKPSCGDVPYRTTAGLMSPYPAGLELPEVEARPACTQEWPPVLAGDDAKPVGRWAVLTRTDGRKQWAYNDYALYTSALDQQKGDVWGARKRESDGGDGSASGAVRVPAGPSLNNPPQFGVYPLNSGRLLTTNDVRSVYVSDRDAPGRSNCVGACLDDWKPVAAPAHVQPQGDWTVIDHPSGIKQWAFRGQPVYTRNADRKRPSLEGGDIPGWRNVYTMPPLRTPKGFTIQDNQSGTVLADARGMTIYVYNCVDDALDQLSCNHPDAPQAYRLALCGRGDQAMCLQTFPYVLAEKGATSPTRLWTVMDIDPKTGRRAAAGQGDALHVWAFRGRPVFHCARDRRPGDIECDSWGEFNGKRNGFMAFWMRDDYGDNDEAW